MARTITLLMREVAEESAVVRGDDASSAFERHVGPVRQSLADLLDASAEPVRRWGYLPAAESQAMAQLAVEKDYVGQSPWGEEPVEQAFNAAHLLMVGGEDSARMACRILGGEPTPMFAHMVLARSVLEHVGRAWWLLEPGISVRLRIARGVNERLNSLSQQESVLIGDGSRTEARERRRRIFDEADRLGFRSITTRRQPRWLEERRPNSTALIRRLLSGGEDPQLGGLLYGYFSAVVHGTMFGFSQSIEVEAPGAPKIPGVTWGAVYTSSRNVCIVLGAMILALENAYRVRGTTLGWRSGELNGAMREALRATRLAFGYEDVPDSRKG